MTVSDIILTLQTHHKAYGIALYPAATITEINYKERLLNIKLPDDLKTFYQFCNGFESAEDLFRIIPLEELSRNEEEAFFYIAEYLIYSDTWNIEINPDDNNDYIILYDIGDSRVVSLTSTFAEFLSRFLAGGVFEKDGLYEWRKEIERAQYC